MADAPNKIRINPISWKVLLQHKYQIEYSVALNVIRIQANENGFGIYTQNVINLSKAFHSCDIVRSLKRKSCDRVDKFAVMQLSKDMRENS